MPDVPDIQLSILDPSRRPWALPHPYPTTLIALWTGARPPMAETVAEAMVSAVPGAEVVGTLSEPPDEALWTLVLELPPLEDALGSEREEAPPQRVIVFAEEAAPGMAHDLDDEAAQRCRWVVGVEALLREGRCLADLATLVRLAAEGCPDSPAVLDVASSTWHTRASLAKWFLDESADPPDWLLWTVHAVSADREFGSDATLWLRTSGLWRCGLAELEILDLPGRLLRPGVSLLSALASLALEEGLPAPGSRWTIGGDAEDRPCAVVLRPWQELVPLVAEGAPGSRTSRQLPPGELAVDTLAHPYAGVRAVVCGPEPIGAVRPVWGPPTALLERLAAGSATLVLADAAAERSARVAQRTAPELCLAAARLLRGGADLAGDDVELSVQAPLRRAADGTWQVARAEECDADRGCHDGGIEHRWLRVVRLAGAALEAVPEGDASAMPVPPEALSDWQARIGRRMVDPDEAEALPAAVDAWLADRGGAAPA